MAPLKSRRSSAPLLPARVSLSALTQGQVGMLLGVSPRTVRAWHSEGLPRQDDASYSGPDVVAWFAGRDQVADQRQRLAAAQAEKAETENAVRRGKVLELEEVLRDVTAANMAIRTRLLAIPSKLAAQLAGIDDVPTIAGRLKTEIYAALTELSNYGAPASKN